MTLDDLTQVVRRYAGEDAEIFLPKAFHFARAAVKDIQKDEAVFSHALGVAGILAEWQAPVNLIVSGLLQTVFSLYETLEQNDEKLWHPLQFTFGLEVCSLVKNALAFDNGLPQEKNLLPYVDTQDWRVVLIKVAECLYFLKSVRTSSSDFLQKTARKALDVFVPTADRFGMGDVRRQLEDLSFEILDPSAFSLLKRHLSKISACFDVNSVIEQLQLVSRKLSIESKVLWQPFSLYSLHHYYLGYEHEDERTGRIERKDRLSTIHFQDTGAFLVLTDTPDKCYLTFGALHGKYPRARQFQDLIALPRGNYYQALYTHLRYSPGDGVYPASSLPSLQVPFTDPNHSHVDTKLAKEHQKSDKEQDVLLHVMIRSHTMDEAAKHGVTARWLGFQEELRLPSEGIGDEIDTFTPDGEKKRLPRRATPIDFAYAIHTDVGERCIGARVNGEPFPLGRPLLDGDFVEVHLGSKETSLSIERWKSLRNCAQTHQAKKKIRRYLVRCRQHDLAESGLQSLDEALQQFGRTKDDTRVKNALRLLGSKLGRRTVQDMAVAICTGEIKASEIALKIDQFLKLPRPLASRVRILPHADHKFDRHKVNLLIAECCHPQMIDNILGSLQGDVILVHKSVCTSVQNALHRVQVVWEVEGTVLVVKTADRMGMAADVSAIMAEHGIDMIEFDAHVGPNGKIEIRIRPSLLTEGHDFESITKDIKAIPFVEEVSWFPSSYTKTTMERPDTASLPISREARRRRSNPGEYYGREEELQQLLDWLSRPRPILVHGQRRIGKTTLLRDMLADRLDEEGDCTHVFINAQSTAATRTTRFVKAIMTKLADAVKRTSAREVLIPDNDELRIDEFHAFMGEIVEETQRHPICLVIDECRTLQRLKDEENCPLEAIFNHLRSLVQDYAKGIRLILCDAGLTSDFMKFPGLNQLISDSNERSLFLGGLKRSDAREMVVQRGIDDHLMESEIEAFLDKTAGHPYYITMLHEEILRHARSRRAEKKFVFLPTDLVNTVDSWVKNKLFTSYVQHLWDRGDEATTKKTKAVLSAVAMLDSGFGVPKEDIAGKVCPRIIDSEIRDAIHYLYSLGVLQNVEGNTYGITLPFVADWMRYHSPLDEVLKDLGKD